MKRVNDLEFDTILDMMASLQWRPENGRVSLGSGQEIDVPILDSLDLFALTIERNTKRYLEDYISLIQRTVSHRPELICAEKGQDIAAEAAWIIDMFEIGPDLIGITNLCTVAYALMIRSEVSQEWNRLCDATDKLRWMAVISDNNTGVPRSIGTLLGRCTDPLE